jgi:hypothetical protein
MACMRCRHEAPLPMGCRWQGRINSGWNPAYVSIFLLPPVLISFASYTSWFLHSPRLSFFAMAAELPPSRLKTTGSLASLRWLMGWQASGHMPKLKHGAASLANMRPGDFVFFVTCLGWAGAAAILFLPHATGVLWALAAALLS